jgi:hypothetical protein
VTPHHVLEDEEEAALQRRHHEDVLDYYYQQLAAADEAGVLDENGHLRTDAATGRPVQWTPPVNHQWKGRGGGGGASSSAGGAGGGGRSFKSGHPVIDPAMFGITESDPDYHAYLTGAKLPPGYFERMGELARREREETNSGGTTIPNNLHQTDYGKYGRQAEQPKHQPSWIKKKLRPTGAGDLIRRGQYDDSPNKFVHRRRVAESTKDCEKEPMAEIAEPPAVHRAPSQQGPTQHKKHCGHSDHHCNASKTPAKEPASSRVDREHERVVAKYAYEDYVGNLPPSVRDSHTAEELYEAYREEAGGDDDDFHDEEVLEEEEYEEYVEEEFEEEEILADDDQDLASLQAILAAKQAELARLQAQMGGGM